MTSEKVCTNHKDDRSKIIRRCLVCLLISALILLIIFLLAWAILKPQGPTFTLEDATIFTVNVSSPYVISIAVQVTVNSRNPNSNIGIYYENLDVYATYQNQQVTYYTAIPPVYQGGRDFNVWCPYIYGENVPVAPYNGVALSESVAEGGIVLTVKIIGHIKWRIGSFVTGRYYLHVTCPPAYIPIGNSINTGIVSGDRVINSQLSRDCRVSI
ncbi:hypothetical protein OROGR_029618 [Orobanche gracilis]